MAPLITVYNALPNLQIAGERFEVEIGFETESIVEDFVHIPSVASATLLY